MFKKILVALAIALPALAFSGCAEANPDEPDQPGTETPKPDNPNRPAEMSVTINDDGTTSNGVPFRRVSNRSFWLNHVYYVIKDSHIYVPDCDNIEVKNSLNGHVTIYSSITLDGAQYAVRYIYGLDDKTNLKSIFIPNSVTEIARQTFCYCNSVNTSLNKIWLPANVQLEQETFYYCKNLQEIYLQGSEPIQFSTDIYSSSNRFYPTFNSQTYSSCTVYVPKGSLDAHKASDWGLFENIKEYNP